MRLTLILWLVAVFGVVACGGGSATSEPTLADLETFVPSRTAPVISTPTTMPTPILTPAPTSTAKPTPTSTPAPTPTAKPDPTALPTPTPNPTAMPTPTQSPTPLPSPTIKPTPKPTDTPIPWKTFSSPDYGYEISLPAGAIIISASADALIVTDPRSGVLLWLSSFTYRDDRTYEETADSWLMGKDTIPGTIQRNNIGVDNLPAFRLSYVRKGPTCDEHESVVFVSVVGVRQFNILGTVCEDDAGIGQATIEEIQNSFIAPDAILAPTPAP